jgi:hypothetical protein
LYIAGGWLLPGRKRIVPYSIQTLQRLKPALFRQDLIALLDLLQQKKIKPLIAQRFPLAEARHAQELLGKGGVVGKIVLVRNGSARGSLSTRLAKLAHPGSLARSAIGHLSQAEKPSLYEAFARSVA